MKSKLGFLLTLLIPILMIGCNHNAHNQPKPHWFKHYTHFDNGNYTDFIREKIENEHDSVDFSYLIRDFYKDRNFHPFWTKNGLQEKDIDTLLSFFTEAPEHGISASFFDYSHISDLILNLKENKTPNNDTLYDVLYKIERSLTKNYLKYVLSLQFGATDPKVIHGRKWYYEVEKPEPEHVRNLLSNIDKFSEEMRLHQPDDKNYTALQNNLAKLLKLKSSALDTIVCAQNSTFKRDSLTISNIRKRLEAFGLKTNEKHKDFEANLDDYLAQFRSNNGLSPECEVSEIISILNHPENNIKKLCANMERLRWKKRHNKSDDTVYICVNIPDYQYIAVQNDSIILKNRICCGKTQNPKGIESRYKNGIIVPFKAETPLLFSYISSITLNPEWKIPYDIIKNEYYPKLTRSNTACINREHIYIKDVRNGRYVVPDSINWNKVSRDNIPYRLYQTSGKYNALGQVKFVFANSESVYLHDTNNKGAFKRRRRALSHGCVRVENPFDLAEWIYIVNKFDTNYIEQLHIISGEEPKTEKGEEFLEERTEKELEYYESLSDYEKAFYHELRPTGVALKKRIPLFIEYYTCFVDENGEIQYREDIYYKDSNIWKTIYPELDL